MTPVKVLRPLCSVCYRRPRVEGSHRCAECGPGRLNIPQPQQKGETNEPR